MVDLKLVKRLAGNTCTHTEIASALGMNVEVLLQAPGFRKAFDEGRGLAGVVLRKRLFDTAADGNSKAINLLAEQFLNGAPPEAGVSSRARKKKRATSAVYRERVIEVGRWMAAGLSRSEAEDRARELFEVTSRQARTYAKDALDLWRKFAEEADPQVLRSRALARREEIFRQAMGERDFNTALRAADSADTITGTLTHRFEHSGPGGGPIKHEVSVKERAKEVSDRFKSNGWQVPDRIMELSRASRN